MKELFKKPGATSSKGHASERTTRVLACCPLGSVVLAFDSASVESIFDFTAGQEPERAVDLAARYGLNWIRGERRRGLVLRHLGNAHTVLVGAEVLVREFQGRLAPLPSFLAGLERSACLRGYMAWPRGYVFVLNLDALLDAPGLSSVGAVP
ncbi:MAG: hypothetical protein QM778_19055 [Myxococcales bacterium]